MVIVPDRSSDPPNADSCFPSAHPWWPLTCFLCLRVGRFGRGWLRAGCRQGSDPPCLCPNSVPGCGWMDPLEFCSSAPLLADAGVAVSMGARGPCRFPLSALSVVQLEGQCWVTSVPVLSSGRSYPTARPPQLLHGLRALHILTSTRGSSLFSSGHLVSMWWHLSGAL